MPDNERFRVGTDEACDCFGVWDTVEQDWLRWGLDQDEAAAMARAANRGLQQNRSLTSHM